MVTRVPASVAFFDCLTSFSMLCCNLRAYLTYMTPNSVGNISFMAIDILFGKNAVHYSLYV